MVRARAQKKIIAKSALTINFKNENSITTFSATTAISS